MSRGEWVGAAVAFLVALALLVVAVKAWNTEPEDVVRKTEDKRRPKETVVRDVDLTNRHFDQRRANELTVRLPRWGHNAEPTVQVNVRRDEAEPWGWAK